jgi:peptidoglycan/LPS O-acetylase OafA/YrhL
VAIALTLVFHYVARSRNIVLDLPPVLARLLDSLWSGVDVFFVLSGFLIGGILLERRGAANFFEIFYLRRVLRILPVAWLAIALVFFVFPMAGLLSSAQASPVPMLAYLAFVNNFWTSAGVPPSTLLSPLWSLAIEEQFYLLAPPLVWWLGRRGLLRLLPGLLLAVLLLSPLMRLYNPWFSAWDATLCRLDGLSAGLLLAVLLRDARAAAWLAAHSRWLAPLAALAVGAALALAVSAAVDAHTRLALGVSLNSLATAAVILHLGVNRTAPRRRLAGLLSTPALVALGRGSYFLYVMHMPMLFLAAWSGAVGPWRPALALVYCLAGAWLSWRLLETPLMAEGARQAYAPAMHAGAGSR